MTSRVQQIAKRATIAFLTTAIVGIFVLVLVAGGGSTDDMWSRIASWDWKQVAIVCAGILAVAHIVAKS